MKYSHRERSLSSSAKWLVTVSDADLHTSQAAARECRILAGYWKLTELVYGDTYALPCHTPLDSTCP